MFFLDRFLVNLQKDVQLENFLRCQKQENYSILSRFVLTFPSKCVPVPLVEAGLDKYCEGQSGLRLRIDHAQVLISGVAQGAHEEQKTSIPSKFRGFTRTCRTDPVVDRDDVA